MGGWQIHVLYARFVVYSSQKQLDIHFSEAYCTGEAHVQAQLPLFAVSHTRASGCRGARIMLPCQPNRPLSPLRPHRLVTIREDCMLLSALSVRPSVSCRRNVV